MSLNEPVGYEERVEVEWSPATGLRRGLAHGLAFAVVLIVVLWPVAAGLPYLLLPWILRAVAAFGIAYVLFIVVQRAAGMASPMVTALVIGLTGLVLFAQHIAFACHGVAEPPDEGMSGVGIVVFPAQMVGRWVSQRGGELIGWGWLHPCVLLWVNLGPALGVGFVVALRHRG